MVVLYMARAYKVNIPAGLGDESKQFYNPGFRMRRPTALAPCKHFAVRPHSCHANCPFAQLTSDVRSPCTHPHSPARLRSACGPGH